jgi:PilZ domain
MELEITETLNVSREGVLVRCRKISVAPGSRAWIVFPYDAAAMGAFEPETPAQVVRLERDASGEFRAGLRLELHRKNGRFPASRERRAVPRVSVCLPIFMRAEGMPWPEEAMTRDFSWGGVRFETPHVYSVGETVHARIPWGEWAGMGEVLGRVVRVEADADPAAPADKVCTAGAPLNWVAVQLAQHG